MNTKTPADVTSYIRQFPVETAKILEQIRDLILKIEPEVTESISYGMPAYKTFGKPLVYFAAYGSHIGFYATPTGHKAFEKDLSSFKQGKGSVQFPLTSPMPFKLIEKIVKFRVLENQKKYGMDGK
ncbi:MAG: DUF1801 domain-containing protein [Flavobacteriales bacterium]|nr:DUF1801 domain-containing protein [Flavobacteriales bacterium]